MENIKVPQTTLVYPLSGSIVIRIIRNREVLLFCKSGKHVQNLNTPLNFSHHARINTEKDTIDPDKYDEKLGIDFTAIPPRNSEDRGETNIRGVEFLNLCKSLNFTVLNGRKTGDLFGKYHMTRLFNIL